MPKRPLALLAAIAASAALTGSASAGSNLFFGFADDRIVYDTASAAAVANDLGAKAFRITLDWEPGQTTMAASDVTAFDRMMAGKGALRIVVSVYDDAGRAPLDDAGRDQYCSYVADVLERYDQIADVVIWNEPNKQHFWKPQFAGDGTSAAPGAYAALLARCWDVLHAVRSGVNVIAAATAPRGNDRPGAVSNVSHSPGNFLRKMGEAYRASGRTGRLFDTVGHHAYGESSAERPWKVHSGSTTLSQGDWASLMQALSDGFGGTGQPIPGAGGVTIWYMEMGYQTIVDAAKASLYSGGETDARAVPDEAGGEASGGTPNASSLAPDQATQIVDGLRLAFCQPYVEAFFNLQVADERSRARWQSAPLWADLTPKDSYGAFKAAIAEINRNGVDCRSARGAATDATRFQPQTTVKVDQLKWPAATSFNAQNALWRFRVKAAENVTYVASIVRVGRAPAAVAAPKPVLTVKGELKKGFFSFITFPRKTLAPGRYRFQAVLTSKANPARKTKLRSPVFTVKAPAR